MKQFIVIIFIALMTFKSDAQKIIPLTFNGKIHGIHYLPFTKVVVFDNRFDTTSKVMIVEDGKYPIKTYNIEKPISLTIEKYIEKVIAGLPMKDDTVYISLRYLKFTSDPKFFFSADAYFKINNNQYRRIASIEKYFGIITINNEVDSSYRKVITKALNYFIKEINDNYYNKSYHNDSLYTLENIDANVENQWGSYQIVNEKNDLDGIYETFYSFRNNAVQAMDLSMELGKDSIYKLKIPDDDKYYNKRSKSYDNIFAVCYKGNIYILVNDTSFLPLQRMKNTFYFYIPHSLPDMYSILSAEAVKEHNSGGANVINSLAGAVVSAVLAEAVEHNAVKSLEKEEKKQILNKGLGGDMRNCFLDMDTGDIIY